MMDPTGQLSPRTLRARARQTADVLPADNAAVFARMESILRRIEQTPVSLLDHAEARARLRGAATADYIRVSSGRQADKYGPPAQRRDIRHKRELHRWAPAITEYEDHITASGKMIRTDFTKLRADAHAGKFKVLMVGRVDRFARNQVMGWLYIYELLAVGVYVYFCVEDKIAGLDLAWKETLNKKLEQAENYVAVLRENIVRSVIERQEDGIAIGRPPFGWRFRADRKYLELVPESAPALRRAFQLALEDELKVASIAVKLNAEGFRYKGQLFNKGKVHGILMNPAAKGCWRQTNPDGAGSARGRWTLLPDRAEPILSAAQYDRVQDILIGRAIGHRNPERVRRNYALIQLLFCGEKLPSGDICGESFWAAASSSRSSYNAFKHRVGVGCCAGDPEATYWVSELILLAQLEGLFAQAELPPSAVAVVARYLNEQSTPPNGPSREEQLRLLKNELLRIGVALGRGAYGDDPVAAEQLWDQERRRVQAKIDALPPQPTLPTEAERLDVLDLFDLWTESDNKEKHRLLSTIFSAMYVTRLGGPEFTISGRVRKRGRSGIVRLVPRPEHALLLAFAFSADKSASARPLILVLGRTRSYDGLPSKPLVLNDPDRPILSKRTGVRRPFVSYVPTAEIAGTASFQGWLKREKAA
jgi:DNA invertase Pin-like site-specific DNA recombinase